LLIKSGCIWRAIRWDQVPTDTFDLSGHANGWGVSLSGIYKFDKGNDVLRAQFV